MGRRAARAIHLGLSVLGAALFFLFLIPRWWVLVGDIPATLATMGRIATGVPIAAAAVPVMLSLQRAIKADEQTPELALRLRAWSAVLHVAAGALMIATAVAEIWLGLGAAGPWLFAVYGGAGALAALAVLAFMFSFTMEKPSKPPAAKKGRPEKAKKRFGRRGATSETGGDANDTGDTADDAGTEQEPPTAEHDDEPPPEIPETPETEPAPALLNKRPTGKRHRLRR